MTPASVCTAVGLDATGRTELIWFEVIGPLIARGWSASWRWSPGSCWSGGGPATSREEARAEEPEPALGPAL